MTVKGVKGKEDVVIVDLQGMKRPFKDLKALDMDEIIEKVTSAIEGV